MFACVTDPEAIVIGGGVSKAGQTLIRLYPEILQEVCIFSMQERHRSFWLLWEMMLGIYGSARMVIKEA